MMRIILTLTTLLIAVLIYTMLVCLTLFEDGSWAVGSYPYVISGCLPWAICANTVVTVTRRRP